MTLSKKQTDLHLTHITASQVPTIMGINDFETRENLMLRKLDPNPEPEEASDAAWRGHMLEDPTARTCIEYLERESGIRISYDDDVMMPGDFYGVHRVSKGVMIPKNMTVNDTLLSKNASDRFAATPDRIITRVPPELLTPGQNPETALLNYEIKTGSSKTEWNGGCLPFKYIVQVQWQMAVLRSWGMDVQCTMIGGLIASNPVIRFIRYDPSLVHRMVGEVVEFLAELAEHRENGTLPEVGEWSDDERERVDVSDMPDGSIAEEVEELFEVDSEIAKLEARQKELKERIVELAPHYRTISSDTHRLEFRKPGTRTIKMYSKLIDKMALVIKKNVPDADALLDKMRRDTTFEKSTPPTVIVKKVKAK